MVAARRVDEPARAPTPAGVATDLALARAEIARLRARVTELEDDLTAARTSLRRMIREEDRCAGAPVTEMRASH